MDGVLAKDNFHKDTFHFFLSWWTMPKINRKLIGCLAAFTFFMACETSNNPLDSIMQSDAPGIKRIADNLEEHEVQILYTQIDRDDAGNPTFTEYGFQLDSMAYFYPASTAKMPVAILALQRLKELNKVLPEHRQLSKELPFIFGVQKGDQRAQYSFKDWDPKSKVSPFMLDTTHQEGVATIGHMIKKIFLVSDNDAYNYLFEFLGRDYVNQELRIRNIGPAHINHKFQVGADNKNMQDFTFHYYDTYMVVTGTKSKVDKHSYPLTGMVKGVGYADNEGQVVNEPFDFNEKNYFSIQSLNQILKAVIFPETLPENDRFDLTEEDYEFLRYWMSRNALESEYPNYNDGEHWDSYVKFFMYGDTKEPMPENVRIYNKVGMAYGTLTDVAYIQDKENGVEFMLTATVHINENGIFNDGVYEYDELGLPFLAELGRQVYDYELKRK